MGICNGSKEGSQHQLSINTPWHSEGRLLEASFRLDTRHSMYAEDATGSAFTRRGRHRVGHGSGVSRSALR